MHYKNNEMPVTVYERVRLSQQQHSTHPLSDVTAETKDVTDHVLVKVSNIPSHMTEEMVQMVFENKRYGGDDIKTLTFCQADHTAIIEFESSAGNAII